MKKVITLNIKKERLPNLIKDWGLIGKVLRKHCTFSSKLSYENVLVKIAIKGDRELKKVISKEVFGEKGFLTERGWQVCT